MPVPLSLAGYELPDNILGWFSDERIPYEYGETVSAFDAQYLAFAADQCGGLHFRLFIRLLLRPTEGAHRLAFNYPPSELLAMYSRWLAQIAEQPVPMPPDTPAFPDDILTWLAERGVTLPSSPVATEQLDAMLADAIRSGGRPLERFLLSAVQTSGFIDVTHSFPERPARLARRYQAFVAEQRTPIAQRPPVPTIERVNVTPARPSASSTDAASIRPRRRS